MCAVLQSDLGNLERVAKDVVECRRMGVEVLGPDINFSDVSFAVEDRGQGAGAARHSAAIRFGLAAIKNVGAGAVEGLVAARKERGPFQNLDDFCRRGGLQAANKRVLESLIKAGALHAFGNRAQLLAILDQMLGYAATTQRAQAIGQVSLFDTMPAQETGIVTLRDIEEAPPKETLAWEKELLGVYLSEHPLQPYLRDLQQAATAEIGHIDESLTGQKVAVAGMVTNVHAITTKKGDMMAFALLEDLQASIEVVLFPRSYERLSELFGEDAVLLVHGRVDFRDGKPKLIADSAQTHAEVVSHEHRAVNDQRAERQDAPTPIRHQPAAVSQPPYYLHVFIPRSGDAERDVQRLGEVYRLLESYRGEDRFSFLVPRGQGKVQLDFPNTTTRYCVDLHRSLESMLGPGAVRVSRPEAAGGKGNGHGNGARAKAG
jgi:DNA polymerase-3 subunit alpha